LCLNFQKRKKKKNQETTKKETGGDAQLVFYFALNALPFSIESAEIYWFNSQ